MPDYESSLDAKSRDRARSLQPDKLAETSLDQPARGSAAIAVEWQPVVGA